MNWHDAVEAAVRRLAPKNSGNQFTRQALLEEEQDQILIDCNGGGATPEQTISRILQELRSEGVIEFVDDRGTYKLLE